MKQISRKQKGRKLQNLLRDKLLKAFPHLRQADLKVGKNGSNGEDLKISRIGRRLIVIAVCVSIIDLLLL